MKYRKKPVVIEAFQMSSSLESDMEFPAWFEQAIKDNIVFDETDIVDLRAVWYVRTMEGIMRISKGDYVIKGVKGEIYPCKPDIFEATYGEVTE